MGDLVKRYRFENKGQRFQRRCAFCHHPKSEMYRVQFEQGGPFYWLCPGPCFRTAQANYKEKLSKGIQPSIETKREDGLTADNEIMQTSIEGEAAIGGDDTV